MKKLYVMAIPILFLLLFATACATKAGSYSTTSSDGTGTETSSSTSEGETTTGSGTALVTYSADLSGKNEVPPVTSKAGGELTLTVAQDGQSVSYSLNVTDLSNVTVAKLRNAKAGAKGAVILTIYGGPTKQGAFSGILAEGSFDASKLVGPLQGKTLEDFTNMVEAGEVYINVGSTKFQNGELRGQLK
jgi:hypothetical protein